ncbi:unnamed protein product [Rhizophagus irregularis]|uniref:Uncharacterized protein n=1 Tax=Rhizophagus irregularis TaxID=588596 RepID=A0A915YYS9_9GLOM|nr:unnamed protein product [Rhizophagus irregularis]
MSIQAIPAKPTYREIESALIAVIKAGILYKKPKDGKFMQGYKERISKLCQAEDPEEYILNTAQQIIPNEAKYHQYKIDYKSWYQRDPKIFNAIISLHELYYKLAKDYFITEEKIAEEVEDFLNS